jgi:hypothetical protein
MRPKSIYVYVLTVAVTWSLSWCPFARARRKAQTKPVLQDLDKRSEAVVLEIYRQKYQNFRHFDTLRWGVHAVAITAGGFVITFAPKTTDPVNQDPIIRWLN